MTTIVLLMLGSACKNNGSTNGDGPIGGSTPDDDSGGYHPDDDSGGGGDGPGDDSGGGDSGGGDSGLDGIDEDGDGYDAADDCNDHDYTVHPFAKDEVGDDIDQDCNGYDGPELPSIEKVAVGDLIVTEIMSSPTDVDESKGEWFEITNVSLGGWDIDGLEVRDDNGQSFVISGTLPLLPGDAVVLGVDANPKENGGVTLDYVYKGFTLDSADAIVLASGSTEIDRVSYTTDHAGKSRSLDPAHFTTSWNDDARAWCDASSTYGTSDHGTPAAMNDDCDPLDINDLLPGEVVINEIMNDPLATDDEYGEWFEVYNASGFPVNLQGLSVSDNGNDETFKVTTTVYADIGGYAIIGSEDDTTINGGVTVDYQWSPSFDVDLSNGADALVISNLAGPLDTVAWDDPGGTFPYVAGASMSLQLGTRDADSNDDGANWCAAADVYGDGDHGTPGADNGC